MYIRLKYGHNRTCVMWVYMSLSTIDVRANLRRYRVANDPVISALADRTMLGATLLMDGVRQGTLQAQTTPARHSV